LTAPPGEQLVARLDATSATSQRGTYAGSRAKPPGIPSSGPSRPRRRCRALAAQRLDDLERGGRVEQPGAHDPLGVQVVDQRAVGADRDAAVAGGLGDRAPSSAAGGRSP
jgi:hypothetical protein